MMRDFPWFPVLLMAGVAVLLVVLFIAAEADATAWRKYVAQHHCHTTGNTREDFYFMTIPNPDGTTSLIPQWDTQNEWLCDDAIHWR